MTNSSNYPTPKVQIETAAPPRSGLSIHVADQSSAEAQTQAALRTAVQNLLAQVDSLDAEIREATTAARRTDAARAALEAERRAAALKVIEIEDRLATARRLAALGVNDGVDALEGQLASTLERLMSLQARVAPNVDDQLCVLYGRKRALEAQLTETRSQLAGITVPMLETAS